ncbi:hypothetical protein OHA40_13720 [Nocardia sp. NBC_00508]|uniref:hypothetical protein n=1 Tax=Nocardia sp. NBC_00508 TaxID=2975992 RepID=UPI002E80751D|nr:hypothetical protein [Nocardia sp. NBC_00508]WUD69086.1 hypothetical protein OHA40_13720 [Nocardia sp. NBC_00508]
MVWVPVAALVATTVGVVAGFYYFVANRRRNVVRFDFDSRRMISGVPGPERLRVSYGAAAIGDPHLVVATLVNRGQKDVRPDDFVQGMSLPIEVSAPVVALIPDQNGTRLPVSRTAHGLDLAPTLLRRNRRYTITAITDGPPTFTVRDDVVADTDISWKESDAESASLRIGVRLLIVGATLLAINVVTTAVFFSYYTKSQEVLHEQQRMIAEMYGKNLSLTEAVRRLLESPPPR